MYKESGVDLQKYTINDTLFTYIFISMENSVFSTDTILSRKEQVEFQKS